MAFSPDGEVLATDSMDRTIRLWNMRGENLAVLEGHTDQLWGVTFSPDGQLLASNSSDKTVRIWNLNGELLNTLEGHESVVITKVQGQKWSAVSSKLTLSGI